MRSFLISISVFLVFGLELAFGTSDDHFNNARQLLNSGRYIEAVDEFEVITKLEPKGSEQEQNARYWIGQCYLRMERFDDAIAQFESVVADYPKSAIAPASKLMIDRVQKEKENAKLKRGNTMSESKTLLDPKTGVEYNKVLDLIGKSDVIEYTSAGFSLSPDARFLLWEKKVVPLNSAEPFDLVDIHANRGVWSPDMKKVVFYSEGIWMIPVSPDTGRPTGEPRKLLDGLYRYQNEVCWSSDSGKVAFLRSGNINTLSINDGSISQVTYDATPIGSVWKYAMSWSHDGKMFAYSAYSQGKWNIWLASADGRTLMKTIETKQTVKPFWSYDDKWIYYSLYEKLYLFDIYNKKEYSISLPKGLGTYLGPSPDEKKMLFYQSSYDFRNTLKVVSSYGGPSLELGRQVKLWLNHFSWTPDSRMIITDGETSEGDPAIWMLPLADEPIQMELDVPNKKKTYPNCLSPDCNRILLLSERDDNTYDVLSVSLSLKDGKVGGEIIDIFKKWNSIPVVGEKLWSPDGKNIVLVHEGDIWIASSDGSKLEQRTETPDIEFFPYWSPDGKMITYSKKGELWMLSLSGGEPQRIRNVTRGGIWTPDSKEMTITDGKKISNVSVADGSIKEICDLKDLAYDYIDNLCWSPDGQRFAFVASNNAEDKPSRIFVFDVKDGKLNQVAKDDLSVYKYSLAWSPDGEWLAYSTEENTKFRSQSIIWEADKDELLKKCEVRTLSENWETIVGKYCYAMFRDAETDMIGSDGRGQYADYNVILPNGKSEDWIDVYFQDDELLKVNFFAGKMQWHYNPAPPSSRRAEFRFDIGKPSKMLDDYANNKAVFDILTKYKDNDKYVERDLNSPMSIHTVATIFANGADGNHRVVFVVDPSPLSPSKQAPSVDAPGTDIRAITQTKVDEFYPDDENVDYVDTGDNNSGYENNQIIYILDYGTNGFNVKQVTSSDGKKIWILTTNNTEPVKLCVNRAIRDDEGKIIKFSLLELAQYDVLPFQFVISESSLDDYVFQKGSE
jgi:Tol biopolymer transport system component